MTRWVRYDKPQVMFTSGHVALFASGHFGLFTSGHMALFTSGHMALFTSGHMVSAILKTNMAAPYGRRHLV